MRVRWSGEVQVNVKSQSELDIGGRESCNCSLGVKIAKEITLTLDLPFFALLCEHTPMCQPYYVKNIISNQY